MTIAGVTMAQPRQAEAQEVRPDARALEQTRTELTTQIAAVRQTLTEMQRQGMPAAVIHTDANMRRLLAAITTLSTQVGSSVFTVSGSNDEEKFRSLNRWLNSAWRGRSALSGRTENSPMDAAALDELTLRLEIAMGRAPAGATADALLGAMRAQPGGGTQQQAPQAPPVVTTPQPQARQAVPSPTADTLRTEYSQLLNDLEFISVHGRSQTIRTRATTLRRELDQQFNRGRRDAAKIRQGEQLVTAELQRAEQRALDSAIEEANRGSAQPHPLSQRANELLQATQGMSQPAAREIARRIPDIFLLGDQQGRQMLQLLTDAKDALLANNERQVRSKIDDATQLFDREQQLYARLLEEYVIPVRTADIAAINGSSLPQRSDLQAAERRYRLPAGTLDNIPVRNERNQVLRRVRTGRDDLRDLYNDRLRLANTELQQRGRLSYRMVTQMYRDAVLEDRSIHSIINLWDLAQRSGLSSSSDASSVYMEYGRAVSWIKDPEVNPFRQFSAEEQQQAIEVYLGLPRGASIPADRARQARGELTRLLMGNSQFRHDSAVYTFYNVVRRLSAPEPALERMSQVRSMRLAVEMEYLPYLAGTPPRIRGMTDDQIANLSQPQLDEQRFRLARGWLEQAVTSARGSGMRDQDELIVAARAWLTQTQTAPSADRMRATADIMYNMALGLLSIREAELWESNANFRPSSLQSATLEQARANIRLARQSYLWNFSRPQVEPAYHFNIPRNFADDAIAMMAPRSFAMTEASGMYSTRTGYLNPDGEGVRLAGTEATVDEQLRGAAAAEQRYLTIIVANRDRDSFFPAPASDTVVSGRGFAGPLRGLDFRVGRARSGADMEVGGFPYYDMLSGRRRPSLNPIDQRSVPSANPSNANLARRDHEDMGHHIYGQLYVELMKQAMMLGDDSTPGLLRGMDLAPNALRQTLTGQLPSSVTAREREDMQRQYGTLQDRITRIATDLGVPADQAFIVGARQRMLSLASDYSGATAPAQQQGIDRLTLAVLDYRIAQLDVMVNGYIMHSDGHPVRVSDLARSRDPKAYYVTRAREALDAAQALRRQVARGDNPVLAREAIAVAEMGIESLTPDHAGSVERPRTPAVTGTFYVPETSIEVDRLSGDPRRVRFRATQVMVEEGGRRQSLQDYERTAGQQNLTYYWFIYQHLGRTDDQGRRILYLLNPAYREANQPRYIGQIMRDVVLEDGTRVGDCVVRVERTRLDPSTGPEWAPRLVNGRVRRQDLLYRIQEGSDGRPIINDLLNSHLSEVGRERTSPVDIVEETATTIPAVIVHSSGRVQR